MAGSQLSAAVQALNCIFLTVTYRSFISSIIYLLTQLPGGNLLSFRAK
jgi:hypothetical protein